MGHHNQMRTHLQIHISISRKGTNTLLQATLFKMTILSLPEFKSKPSKIFLPRNDQFKMFSSLFPASKVSFHIKHFCILTKTKKCCYQQIMHYTCPHYSRIKPCIWSYPSQLFHTSIVHAFTFHLFCLHNFASCALRIAYAGMHSHA